MKQLVVAGVCIACLMSGAYAEGKQEPPRRETAPEKFADYRLEAFTEALASKAPTPGGGSAAAVEGALGMSLLAMVAEITAGRKEYAPQREELLRIRDSAQNLRRIMLDLADADAQAYGAFLSVRSLPRETEEQKQAYRQAMQETLKTAAMTPFLILQSAAEGLRLAQQSGQNYYVNTASDLGLAAQSLKTAAQGAEMTVLINLGAITDADFTAQYADASKALLEEAVQIADALYAEIHAGLLQ